MALVKTATITNPVNAGATTDWINVDNLADMEFLIESTLNQTADFTMEGAADADGTGAQTLDGGAALSLAAGNVTTAKGILALAVFPGFVRVKCDPAADSTGTATIRVLAHPRK